MTLRTGHWKRLADELDLNLPGWGDSTEDRWRKIELTLHKKSTRGESFVVGRNVETGESFEIPLEALVLHLHVIGSTGGGKSFFLEMLMQKLISKGHGLCLIDPHGFLYDHMKSWLSFHPEYADRVVLFDPTDPDQEFLIGYNPFKRAEHIRNVSVQVRHLIAAAAKVWAGEESKRTPRIRRWLGNLFFPMLEGGHTIVQVRSLLRLMDPEEGMSLAYDTKNQDVIDDWMTIEGMRSLARKQELLEGVQTRIREFVGNSTVELMMRNQNTLSIPEMVEEKKIVICNLSQRNGMLFEDDAFLIGCLLVSELVNYCIVARTEEEGKANPFFLFIDELQNFLSLDIAVALEQCRKFGLHAILAHQSLAQLREEDGKLYSAVMGSARNKVIFGGLEGKDRELLDSEINDHDLKEIKQEIYRTAIVDYEVEEVTTSTSTDSWGYGDNEGHSGGADEDDWRQSSGKTISRAGTVSTSTSTRNIPVFDEELSSRDFYSLQDQQYRKQRAMKNLPRQHAIIKLEGEPPQTVRIEDVQQYPEDEDRLRELDRIVFLSQRGYYLRESEIVVEDPQRALKSGKEQLSDFRNKKKF